MKQEIKRLTIVRIKKNNPENTKKIQQKESERLKIDKNKDVESQFKLNTPNKGKESENDDSSSGK